MDMSGITFSIIGIIFAILALGQAWYYNKKAEDYNKKAEKTNEDTMKIDEYTYLTSLYNIIELRAMIRRNQSIEDNGVILEKDKIKLIKMHTYKKTNAEECLRLLTSANIIKYRLIDNRINEFLTNDKKDEHSTNLTHKLMHHECESFITLCEKLVKEGIRVFLIFD